MPFSSNEKIANSDKLPVQITGSKNAPPGEGWWYNEDLAWVPIVTPERIWGSHSLIPGASNPAAADAAVTANPTILEKRTVRLTQDPTSNLRAYEARMTFGDRTTDFYDNWIQPSLIRNLGSMSAGYGIRFYNGDPAGAGVEITTTQWGGAGGSPSWQFSYSTGLIICSSDQIGNFGGAYTANGLYIVGYRYIGPSGSGGGALQTSVTQANTFTQGQAIYLNSGTGLWELAQANNDDTMGVALADAPTAGSFTAIYGGPISGFVGLVPGEYYWVSDTVAGALTATKPSDWHNPLLHAETTTGGMVLPWRPSKDTATGGGGPPALTDRTISATGPITNTDVVVYIDGSSSAVTATFPDASTVDEQLFYIIAINVDNMCKLALTGGQTISGQNGFTFALQWERIQVYSNGVNYIIVG